MATAKASGSAGRSAVEVERFETDALAGFGHSALHAASERNRYPRPAAPSPTTGHRTTPGSLPRKTLNGSEGCRSACGRRTISKAQTQMLAVIDRFVEKLGDVIVVEAVNDAAARAGAGDQTEVA